jgi:hypothetical protein
MLGWIWRLLGYIIKQKFSWALTLSSPRTDEEVWGVIKELPPDRAVGLDGFVGAFYQKA